MNISKTVHVINRDEWRAWLAANFRTEREVWLIYYKKQSGQPRIPYEVAVEEALCFGWVDSIVKRIDDEKYAQKFTPRRNHTKWSALNVQRMEKLIKEGRMTEAGLVTYDPAARSGEARPEPRRGHLEVPPFVEQALKACPPAWTNFERLPPSHRKNYLRWIMEAKKEETRLRRLREAVSLLERNKKLGLK
jgi:uncharacterized protein YdeI (YjbR/CyaY-like superfamily)